MTPLHVAARHRCLPLLRVLIDARARVELRNPRDGWTPLHCAAASGDLDCTRELLKARADPRCHDEARRLPFELAVRCPSGQSYAVQEVLLAHMEDDSTLR